MERQLFDWEEWEAADAMSCNFYKCTLKVDTKHYKAGDTIPMILFNIDAGRMYLLDDNKRVVEKVNLKLVVCE